MIRVVVVPRGSVVHLVARLGDVPICGRYDDDRAPDLDETDDDELPVCVDCARKTAILGISHV